MNIMFCHLGREHLGIEYLSAVLKQNGFKVGLAYDPGYFSKQDNTIHSPFMERIFKREKEMLNKIYREKPDIVAFSVYTATYKWATRIAKLIKENIETKIVFGGTHPTLIPNAVINNKYVDFVVIGEGEERFLELVRSLEKGNTNYEVDNVYFRKGNRIIKNKVSATLANLDLLPYPDKELFENYIYYKDSYLALASRGCPNSCSYCCESFLNNKYNHRYFRQRSVKSIIGELEYMKDRYDFKEIVFFDNIFHIDKRWLRSFLKEYKSNINVLFKCMAHVSLFDKETAILLKGNCCYAVNFGIQSMDENVRERVLMRHTTNNQIENALRICDEVNLQFDIDLIFDLPGEKEENIIKKAGFFKQFRSLNRVKCFNLSYFPKLDIVNIARNENLISDSDIKAIENGEAGDPFHVSTSKDRHAAKVNRALKIFYKILPALPLNLVKYFSLKKRYYKLYYIPEFLVILLQVFIGLRNRDPRFQIYLKDYLRRFKYPFQI